MDIELQREINGLMGDINLTKLAVSSVQNSMKEELAGGMGEDIRAVLSGERKVEAGKYERRKFRLKSWFRRLFRRF